jgi:signal transduction histidine kinase
VRLNGQLARALTALSWCAVPAFALVQFAQLSVLDDPVERRPPYQRPLVDLHPSPAVSLLAACLLALPLAWSSRRPVPVMAVLGVAAVGLRAFVGDGTWPPLLTGAVLVVHIAITCDRRVAAWSVGGLLTAWCLVYLTSSASPYQILKALPANLVVIILAGWILGSWIRLRQDHAETLRTQGQAQAVQAERLRIARELHDMVAHSIGVIAIQAGAAALVVQTQPEGARKAMDAVGRTSRETLAALRRMLVALREEDAVGGSAPAPGLADLDRLLASAADAGLAVDMRVTGERRALPMEIELSAYRIVQESLTNVIRHAGTDRCRVRLDYLPQEVAVEVVDAGRGGPGPGAAAGTGYGITGYGILGMRERVGLLHGHLDAGPVPGGGFRVAARLPA